MCAQVPACGSFVGEANTLVAVGCKLLAHSFAIGKDEVVVDVCDHDDDGSVVRAIGINAIMDRRKFEELGQMFRFISGSCCVFFLLFTYLMCTHPSVTSFCRPNDVQIVHHS